jgi:hypothetical protein
MTIKEVKQSEKRREGFHVCGFATINEVKASFE